MQTKKRPANSPLSLCHELLRLAGNPLQSDPVNQDLAYCNLVRCATSQCLQIIFLPLILSLLEDPFCCSLVMCHQKSQNLSTQIASVTPFSANIRGTLNICSVCCCCSYSSKGNFFLFLCSVCFEDSGISRILPWQQCCSRARKYVGGINGEAVQLGRFRLESGGNVGCFLPGRGSDEDPRALPSHLSQTKMCCVVLSNLWGVPPHWVHLTSGDPTTLGCPTHHVGVMPQSANSLKPMMGFVQAICQQQSWPRVNPQR